MSVATRPGATTFTWIPCVTSLLGHRQGERLESRLRHVVGGATGSHVGDFAARDHHDVSARQLAHLREEKWAKRAALNACVNMSRSN